MKRRSAALAVILAITLVTTCVWAQEPGGEEAVANVEVSVDGNPISFTRPVLMVNMQFALLPAETFLNALGATTEWNAGPQRLDVTLDETQVQMWVGRQWVTVNGARQDLDFGLQTLSETPYVPGAATAALLGIDVHWDQAALSLAVSHPTTMPEGPTVTATLLELVAGPPATLTVRVIDTGQVGEVPLSEGVVIQRGAAEDAPAPAELADLQPGDLLEIVFDDTSTGVGIRASYLQTLGTIASIQGNRLTVQGPESYPLGEGVEAVGSDGGPLHLLAAVGQGAILTLNPNTNAVWRILAQRRGTATPPATGDPVIAAFTVPRYDVPLGEGASLQIHVVGTAGAECSVQLGAAGPAVSVPEGDPGIYSGAMTIPAGLLVPDEFLVAQLQAGEATSQSVQSNRPVTIDAEPPVLELPVPGDAATIGDVNTHVRMKFHDGEGVGVDPSTATLSLDGTDVTAGARIDEDQIFYDTPGELAPGQHTASASLADQLGNAATRTWSFTIEAADEGIVAVSHDATEALSAGDTLTVTVQVAAPGRAASFSVEGVVEDVAMARVGDTNSYQGTYTVREGDVADNATVEADFTGADGTRYEANAAEQVSIATPEVPLAITTPAADAQTGRRITPAGTAPPGSRVRWTVSYQEFILAGDIATGEVEADAAGNWRAAGEVDLKLLLIGMADAYTVRAELLDAAGAVQQTTTVEFTAKN